MSVGEATSSLTQGVYLAHWLLVLKEDKRAIFLAAAHAQRAADYLQALQPVSSAEQLAA